MKLGVMQPYFFPYIGYFQLINAVDKYIFSDTTQYVRKSWMNRNRVIKLEEGSTFITVPVEKVSIGTKLNEIVINNAADWRAKIMAQFDIYRKRAPHFWEVSELVRTVLDKDTDSLAQLNINSVKSVFEYLGLPFEFDTFSRMDIKIPAECKRGERAAYISKDIGAHTYINAPGGKAFYPADTYRKMNIKLQFINPALSEYDQKIGRFEPGLSIIDVLMFNDVDTVLKMLNDYILEDA